jgi:hypothetical protein
VRAPSLHALLSSHLGHPIELRCREQQLTLCTFGVVGNHTMFAIANALPPSLRDLHRLDLELRANVNAEIDR